MIFETIEKEIIFNEELYTVYVTKIQFWHSKRQELRLYKGKRKWYNISIFECTCYFWSNENDIDEIITNFIKEYKETWKEN